MPLHQIRNRYPRRHAGPQLRRAPGHQQTRIPAARGADHINPVGIHVALFPRPRHRAENILHRQLRTHRLRRAIATAEVGMNEMPTVLHHPQAVSGVSLPVIAGPRMQPHQQRPRLLGLGREMQRRLIGIIHRTAVFDLPNLLRPTLQGSIRGVIQPQ